jgi:hypothetical protein
VGASVHDFHSVESKMSLLTRLIHKFRKSVHHEPPEMTAKILDNSDPSNPEPGTCVWRIADSGEISNSPHTASATMATGFEVGCIASSSRRPLRRELAPK